MATEYRPKQVDKDRNHTKEEDWRAVSNTRTRYQQRKEETQQVEPTRNDHPRGRKFNNGKNESFKKNTNNNNAPQRYGGGGGGGGPPRRNRNRRNKNQANRQNFGNKQSPQLRLNSRKSIRKEEYEKIATVKQHVTGFSEEEIYQTLSERGHDVEAVIRILQEKKKTAWSSVVAHGMPVLPKNVTANTSSVQQNGALPQANQASTLDNHNDDEEGAYNVNKSRNKTFKNAKVNGGNKNKHRPSRKNKGKQSKDVNQKREEPKEEQSQPEASGEAQREPEQPLTLAKAQEEPPVKTVEEAHSPVATILLKEPEPVSKQEEKEELAVQIPAKEEPTPVNVAAAPPTEPPTNNNPKHINSSDPIEKMKILEETIRAMAEKKEIALSIEKELENLHSTTLDNLIQEQKHLQQRHLDLTAQLKEVDNKLGDIDGKIKEVQGDIQRFNSLKEQSREVIVTQ